MYRLFIALLLTAGTILSSCAQKNKEREFGIRKAPKK